MFAVVTTVELPEGGTIEEGRKQLESDVIPRMKQAPGFVAAYFLAPKEDREGLSFIMFESKEAAMAVSENMQPPPPVRLLHSEVREVAASA
jgi:heme-degrading monooxygenase HmoA